MEKFYVKFSGTKCEGKEFPSFLYRTVALYSLGSITTPYLLDKWNFLIYVDILRPYDAKDLINAFQTPDVTSQSPNPYWYPHLMKTTKHILKAGRHFSFFSVLDVFVSRKNFPHKKFIVVTHVRRVLFCKFRQSSAIQTSIQTFFNTSTKIVGIVWRRINWKPEESKNKSEVIHKLYKNRTVNCRSQLKQLVETTEW